MSSNDCTEVCDLIIDLMCKPCPNYKKCQNGEDEANHDQMLLCLVHGVLAAPDDTELGIYPTEFEPLVEEV